MTVIIKEINSIIYPIIGRGAYVFLQFFVVFLYSRSLSTDDLASFNLLNTFILLFSTLLLHPFDVELQKRYVLRFQRKTATQTFSDIHKNLTIFSFIFISIAVLTHIITPLLSVSQFTFLIISLSLSQYVSHSIRCFFLNAGEAARFNLLTLTELSAKLLFICVVIIFGHLSIFWLVLSLWISNVIIVLYFLTFSKSLNLRLFLKKSIRKAIFLSDKRFFFRAFSNIWHWSITNLFKILFAVNGQTDNLAMGIMAFVVGNSIMQSINLIVSQLTYPKIYQTNGKIITGYVYSVFILATLLTVLLLIFGNVMLKTVFGERFDGYKFFLIAGLWTEMFNGVIGVIGVRLNFLKLDKKFMNFYVIGAFASFLILLLAYFTGETYFAISAPIIGLIIPIALNMFREKRA